MEVLLVFAGFFVGLATGATAIGTGLLTVPMLMLLGFRPTEAVGTALAVNFATRLVAAWQHNRQKTIHYGWVALIALGSLPASVAVTWMLSIVKPSLSEETLDLVVSRLIGVALVAMALVGIALEFVQRKEQMGETSGLKVRRGWCKFAAPLVGAITGASVTITGIGAGGIVVGFLAVCASLTPQVVVGTAIFHGVILSLASLFGHILIGNFSLTTALLFLFGSLPGALLGSRLCLLLPKRVLKLTLLSIVLASGIKALV